LLETCIACPLTFARRFVDDYVACLAMVSVRVDGLMGIRVGLA